MKKFKTIKIISLLFILNVCIVNGQTKNEREEKVALSEFPTEAQKVITLIPKACKRIKFLREIDGKKTSYEAKFKYKKQFYSLEFSKAGIIEDIEIKVKPKHIKAEIKNEIDTYLKQSYLKVNWVKLQRQFVFDTTLDTQSFLDKVFNNSPSLSSNFELIAEVKTKEKRHLVEFLFGPNGEFISQRIVSPSSYNHVLY